MTRTEFDTAVQAFGQHFMVAGTTPITNAAQTFTYATLAPLVTAVPGDFRLVVVHYGLEGTGMRYGFSFTNAVYDPVADKYVHPFQADPSHILAPDGSMPPVNGDTWRPLRDAYRNQVQVKPTAESGFLPLVGTDALRAKLPWDAQLEHMYKDTTDGITGTFRMLLASVSIIHPPMSEDGQTSPAGYRHGVAFHVEQFHAPNWVRMLSNKPENKPFKNRAADYGTLCPVNCITYLIPS